MPCAVVSVNSSMLARVPGPAERDAMDATISAYGTGVTRETAATIGMVACPPQVTMLTLRASRCSSRLTAGTTNGPFAAGVRSTSRLPSGSSISALARCAFADVASKTIPISSKFGSATKPSTPSEVAGDAEAPRAGEAV